MKLCVLGASSAQLIGIIEAKKMGHEVISCDNMPQSIGHSFSDGHANISTFDLDGVLEMAKRESIDGILTLGTDQPVLTVAYVAQSLGLPRMLDFTTARDVTNKKYMKAIFKEHNIPSVDYQLYKKGYNEEVLEKIQYPVVVKPLDSQGQRGVYYLENSEAVIAYFDKVVGYSREEFILVETFYEHEEVTISGWVEQGKAYILTITDRVTFSSHEHIGICLSHEFPSKHMECYGNEMIDLSQKIVGAFNLETGPIYFQFLIGKKGILVNEIACRIGGAYEATFIPYLTGFDLCKTVIKASLGQEYDVTGLYGYDMRKIQSCISVQLFFCAPCKVHFIPEEASIRSMEGIVDVGIALSIGDEVKPIHNATARAGFVIVQADSKKILEQRLNALYDRLIILDQEGNNHIIHREMTR